MKSERKFDHSKYSIAHSVYNFEGIIAKCFSDNYKNRSDIKWQKGKTIKLCEVQCILYLLTKKLLESGPCYISRNYYLKQSKLRNIQSLKDRYFRMTGEIIIEDYKKDNPAYLNRLLNKLNPEREGKGKRNKFTEDEKHIMIRHFGRRLNHKKISFIHRLLESKRLIRITRKSYKSNYIEMRKRNPFYKFI